MPQATDSRTLYVGSGSPYAWRAWLALEHKRLPYALRVMSFSAGDLRTPAFAALNPRHKVPLLDDAGFAIYESAAIVEYLEDAYPAAGGTLFPADARRRAIARRKIREADEYVAHALETMVDPLLFTAPEQQDAKAIGMARDRFIAELDFFERELDGEFLVDAVGAADFTLYPMLALALRMETRKPDLRVKSGIGPRLSAWIGRVEALPFFMATYPPHWKTAA